MSLGAVPRQSQMEDDCWWPTIHRLAKALYALKNRCFLPIDTENKKKIAPHPRFKLNECSLTQMLSQSLCTFRYILFLISLSFGIFSNQYVSSVMFKQNTAQHLFYCITQRLLTKTHCALTTRYVMYMF